MYKILAVAVIACVAAVAARPQHGHEHAQSSQSLVLHASHGHEQHEQHGHHEQQEQHEHHDQYDHHDYYAHPKYEFEYKVQDPHTGDYKTQHESRDGDVVKGFYSLHEADGTVRVVKYAADKHTGFTAEVHREGHAKHAAPHHH